MLRTDKQKWIWGILIASGVMILVYDLGMLVRNRLKPCDLKNQDCASGSYCSQTSAESGARCLPLPAQPSFVLTAPFEPFNCVIGNLQAPGHIQDDSAFRLKLSPKPNSPIAASHTGKVFYYSETQDLRILHPDGYVSYYQPIQNPRVKSGESVEAGAILGSSQTELEFGVYYLNPGIAEAAHREKPPKGFSIPFKMNVANEEIPSLKLPCSHPSGAQILNH